MAKVIIVRASQTSSACPSQWDAWNSCGRYWYLRYRFGRGTMTRGYRTDNPARHFTTGEDLDGYISLEEFCENIGVLYMPELDNLISVQAVPDP